MFIRYTGKQFKNNPDGGIAPTGTAVREIDQHLDRPVDDVVRFDSFETANEAHPAGVVLVLWVVEALL